MHDIALQHKAEVAKCERFEFGKNWTAFLAVLDDKRIAKAEDSLKEMAVQLKGEAMSWDKLIK